MHVVCLCASYDFLKAVRGLSVHRKVCCEYGYHSVGPARFWRVRAPVGGSSMFSASTGTGRWNENDCGDVGTGRWN